MKGRQSEKPESRAIPPAVAGSFPVARIIWYSVPALFAFLFFPFRALQWVSIIVLLFIIVAYAFSYILYRGLSVRAMVPVTYGYRDDTFSIEVLVTNNSRLPAINLGILAISPSELPGQQKRQGFLTLQPGLSEKFTAGFTMRRRGEFALPLVTLEGSDPFSLFSWQTSRRNLCRVVVYPAIHHGVFSPKRGLAGGAIRVSDPLYEDVNRIGSIREYVPGDDIRRIHWNATAKSGNLRTSELLSAMDAPSVVLFDLDAAVYEARYRYERIETAIEIAASLIHALGDVRQRVGLVSNGLDRGGFPVIPPTGRTDSAALALRILARIAASEDTPDPVSMFLDARFPLQAGMGCFIISPRSPDTLASRLMHPTMSALKPVYFHLSDRRAEALAHSVIDYVLVDSPARLFNRGA